MSINFDGFIPTYLTIYSNQTPSEVLQFMYFGDILKISNFYSSLSHKCNVNGSVRVEWDCPNKGQVYAGRKNLSTLISGIRMLNTRGKILIQLVSEYYFFSLKMIGKRCCTDFNYSNQELWNKVWNFVELYIQRLIDLLPSSDGDSGYGRLILAGQKESFQTDLNDCDCESTNKYDHINNYQITHLLYNENWNGTYRGNDNNFHTITDNINKINILIKLINNEIKKQDVVGWGCTIDLGLHSLAFVPELVAKDLNNCNFGLHDWYELGVYRLSDCKSIWANHQSTNTGAPLVGGTPYWTYSNILNPISQCVFNLLGQNFNSDSYDSCSQIPIPCYGHALNIITAKSWTYPGTLRSNGTLQLNSCSQCENALGGMGPSSGNNVGDMHDGPYGESDWTTISSIIGGINKHIFALFYSKLSPSDGMYHFVRRDGDLGDLWSSKNGQSNPTQLDSKGHYIVDQIDSRAGLTINSKSYIAIINATFDLGTDDLATFCSYWIADHQLIQAGFNNKYIDGEPSGAGGSPGQPISFWPGCGEPSLPPV